MEGLVRGDIVIIPVPYSDIFFEKKRSALVIAVSGKSDYIFCSISTKNTRDRFCLELNSEDLVSGALIVKSYVHCNRIFTLYSGKVLYKVGRLTRLKHEQVIVALLKLIRGDLE